MKLFNSFIVPVNYETKQRFALAVETLHQKLSAVDTENLPVSAYSKKYFKDYQRKLQYSLEACAFILMHAIHQSKKKIEHSTIVDYGAGTGVLAMLAKEVGFGKVIYNDIYSVSCDDAECIAEKVNAKANEYICGDVSALTAYFKRSNTICDMIVSRNVIEHIYDLEEHFNALSKVPSNELTLFFATTANIKNPLTVWYTQRIQNMLEYKGMANKWGKERDTSKPFFSSRKEIIKEFFPEVKNNELEQLAAATRGLIKADIENAVYQYRKTNQIPKLAVEGCNTCDPLTGNRAEHLMSPQKYQFLFQNNGFEFKMLNGFYNTHYAKKWLNFFTPIVNLIIKIAGEKGVFLAPFIGLKGHTKKV